MSRTAARPLRPPSQAARRRWPECAATARIMPHTTATRKGRAIVKHQNTSTARTPILSATSAAVRDTARSRDRGGSAAAAVSGA